MLVIDVHPTLPGKGCKNIPVLVADLIGVRMEGSVRGDHAVAVERAVRRVIFIEITSEGEDVVGAAFL